MIETGSPDHAGSRQPVSYLFVPGNRPDRFAKAAASGADSIIIDLEDAVGTDEKERARAAAVDWFTQGGAGVLRINGADTPWFGADLAALAACPQAVVMVPKANAPVLNDVSGQLPGRPLIALLESVEGLMQIHDLAAVPGVVRIAFGNLDFGLDARIPGTGATLDPVRLQIAIASRHAGLPPPVDGVTVDLEDMGALAADVARARDLGFTAKLCLHPRQVAAVNGGFAPTDAEIGWARRVIAAVNAATGGVVQLDGKMVDRPVVARAHRLLGAISKTP